MEEVVEVNKNDEGLNRRFMAAIDVSDLLLRVERKREGEGGSFYMLF